MYNRNKMKKMKVIQPANTTEFVKTAVPTPVKKITPVKMTPSTITTEVEELKIEIQKLKKVNSEQRSELYKAKMELRLAKKVK